MLATAFTEYLAVEASFSRSENRYTMNTFDFKLGPFDLGEQFDARHTAASGNLVVQIPTSIGLVPYATGGAGFVRTTPVQGPIGGEDSASGVEFNFGGGIKYFFSTPQCLGVRFDVRYRKSEGLNLAGGSSSGMMEFTVGAAARFF